MRIFKFLILFSSCIILFSCEEESGVFTRELTFNGTVKSGDTERFMPNEKVKLEILGYDLTTNSHFQLSDSTITGSSGDYSFKIKYNPLTKRLTRYQVRSMKEYHERYVGTSVIPFTFFIYSDVDTVNVNTNNFVLCQTGHIKLVANKLEPSKADTLFYSQLIDSSLGNVLTSRSFITETQSKKVFKYFTKFVSKTTLRLRVKKENGTITESENEVDITPNNTAILTIEY